MDPTLRACVALLVLPLCSAAAAQGMYKCKDAAGKITYSGKECQLIGLTPAGEVTGRATVTPALKPPASSPAASAAPARAAAPASQGAAAARAPAAPAAPEKRCFVVKTAKGTATRCNDTPEEDAAGK